MRRLALLIVLVVAAVSWSAFRSAPTTDASAVEGVWRSVHFERSNGERTSEWDNSEPNLLIFSKSHFANVFVVRNGPMPRETLPEDPTDEQLLAAWRPVEAVAGTYEVKGHEIYIKVIVAKDPNSTAEQAESSAPFEVDGDTMVRTFSNDEGTETFKVTYMRVE